jgi:hypothetical protein
MLLGSQLVRALDTACSFGLSCFAINIDLINQPAQGIEALVYGVLVIAGIGSMLVDIGRKWYHGRWAATE